MSVLAELGKQTIGIAIPAQVAQEGGADWDELGPLGQYLAPGFVRMNRYHREVGMGETVPQVVGSAARLLGSVLLDWSLNAAYTLTGMATTIGLEVFGTNPVLRVTAGVVAGIGLKLLTNGLENAVLNRAHGISLRRPRHR